MKKITIKNSITQEVTHGGMFENESQANDWIEKQIAKNSWGKPERWQVDYLNNPVLQSDKDNSLETRQFTDPVTEDVYIEYLLPCEYIIEQEDYEVPYYENRATKYQEIDHLLKEALVEKELGDSTKWDNYIALRNQIKLDYPKPE